jgi:hypothetical protein
MTKIKTLTAALRLSLNQLNIDGVEAEPIEIKARPDFDIDQRPNVMIDRGEPWRGKGKQRAPRQK